MENLLTLYTWFGTPRVESAAVTGVYLIRYLNFLKIPFELKLMPIVAKPKFMKEVEALPIFNINGQFMSPDRALSLLEKSVDGLSPRMSVEQLDLEILSLHQWGLRKIAPMYFYFMFGVEDNKAKLQEYLNSSVDSNHKTDLSKYSDIFEQAISFGMSWKRDYTENLSQVFEVLKALEFRLNESEFLTGDDPAHCDISVFSAIHSLFNPMISEFANVEKRYPALIKWCHAVDNLTAGPHIRRFSK